MVPKFSRVPVSVASSRNVSVKPLAAPDVAVVEVAVLVLERDVVVEPERPQVGEVLDLVRGVDSRGDRRQHSREDQRSARCSSRCDSASSRLSVDSSSPEMLSQRDVLHELRQVESGVAHHRRDDAAADEVDEAPDRAEHAGGDRRVVALVDVPEAEHRAVTGSVQARRRRDTDRTGAG